MPVTRMPGAVTRRLPTTLAGLLLLAACDGMPVAPTAGRTTQLASSAEVQQTPPLLEEWVEPFGPRPPCLNERVEVHFRRATSATYVVMADGQRLIESIHANERGSYAIGQTTGATYRVSGTYREHFSDGLTGELGAGSGGRLFFLRFSGSEGQFELRLNDGFAISPDGTLRAFHFSFEAGCP